MVSYYFIVLPIRDFSKDTIYLSHHNKGVVMNPQTKLETDGCIPGKKKVELRSPER